MRRISVGTGERVLGLEVVLQIRRCVCVWRTCELSMVVLRVVLVSVPLKFVRNFTIWR